MDQKRRGVSPPKDIKVVFDEDSAGTRNVFIDDDDHRDKITIDPVIKEPKLDDILMTSMKIGRSRTPSDAERGSPLSPTNDSDGKDDAAGSRDCLEEFLNRSRVQCTSRVWFVQKHTHSFLLRHKQLIKRIFLILVLLAYVVYFCFAVWFNAIGALVIIILTSLIVLAVVHKLVMRRWGTRIDQICCLPIERIFDSRQCQYFRW
jgi:hypothetical protein